MKKQPQSHGRLCLTFDDRNFDNWLKVLPLWRKYDAGATFFVSGTMDALAIDAMTRLQEAGHTVGLHALHHAKYPAKPDSYIEEEILPQLDICCKNDINIRAFAYPFSLRDEASDRKLFEIFDFLRGGAWQILEKDQRSVDNDRLFLREVSNKQLFFGMAASGNFDFHTLSQTFYRAAERNETIVFYAHDITEKVAPSHHISIGQLEVLLKLATALEMDICGFNEL